jgi:RecG-like helicase/REP element-mobilizing transposase RayT
MSMLQLTTPLSGIEWLQPQRVRQLERFGLDTVHALLTHFPRRYEDRNQFERFPSQEGEKPVCVCGVVVKTAVKRLPGWKKLFEVHLQEENANALSPTLICRWFNLHYVEKMIATGQRVVVYGKPKLRAGKIIIDHPEFEVVENDDEVSIHLKRITPVHPATEGISPRVLRAMIFRVLEQLEDESVPDRLPPGLDDYPHAQALRQIHFPKDQEELEKARRHLVMQEFFAMQLFVAAKRAEATEGPGERHCGTGKLVARFHEGLPFPLTSAQKRTIEEIRMDLASNHPMNRMLHGDVGSGKTVVALSAMLSAVEAGFQAALMAPTQILAEQHYLNFKRWLTPVGIEVALRTASRKEQSMQDADKTVRDACVRVGSALVPSAGADVPSARTLPGAVYSKRRLPHFERPWAIYAVTMSTRARRPLSPTARSIILDSILHFHKNRYELFAACVMPDHVHLIFQPEIKEQDESGNSVFWSLPELMKSLKSFSAHAINKSEGVSGPVWEKESFDRFIRSDTDLAEKFNYICRNPWDSEVVGPKEDYPWLWTHEDEFRASNFRNDFESSSRRDAATSTRDACAPQKTVSNPRIVIGTHALLYEGGFDFTNLGLVVIDEQHKFGVLQRARLIGQARAPDVLVMTATPIPRTLTMTVFGDLDVSTLDEMPANRGKIITALRDDSKLPEAVKFIREHLEAGRQAYIVYPLIEQSEKLEVKAATREFEKWKELLAPMECELLHGRIDPDRKEAIMERFRNGEIKALIATTVIEVGIDVANANLMLIENAERFGLAQLHQLRGRIGRGKHKSYCILLSAIKNLEAIEKLKILEQTSNGFEIAEADLRMRGPGDILGTAQSGLPPLKLGNLISDADWMRLARKAARELFATDPHLELPENQRFKELLVESRKLILSQVG